MRSSHGGGGSGDYAINSAREALPEGGRGRGDVGEAVGETERGETRRRARGGSTELPAAMATAAPRLLLRAGQMKEAERVQSSGEAAGRRPFQSGQHTARSGQVERMAATRRPSSVAGRP